MELTIGEKTNQEMAEWFGCTIKTFTNTKAKRLEELKYFAKFHEERGKVIIDEVSIPVYQKQARKTYEKIKQKINCTWALDGLDTCSHVGETIYKDLSDDNNLSVKESTVVAYTREGRNELYGKPFEAPGTIGKCIYTWCKLTDDAEHKYQAFTAEEEDIKHKLWVKYYGRTEDQELYVQTLINAGRIREADAWSVFKQIQGLDKEDKFIGFINELQEAVGAPVVRAT